MVAKEDSIKIQSIDAVYSQKDPEIDTGKLLKIPLRETAAYIFCLILATVYVFLIAFRASAKDGFVIAILSYIFIASRLLGKIINFSFISDPLSKMVDLLSAKTANFSEKILLSILAAALVSTMLIVSLTTAETATGNRLQRMQSFLGIFVFLVVLVLFSKDRKNIPWRTVVVGMTLQYLIALFVLKTSVGVDIFSYISKLITKFLQLSEFGLIFLFGPDVLKIQNFIVAVFPAIVFFCSFISVVYYFGGMQYIISKIAWVMVRLMSTSGAESVVAAASPFVGQGESALLVKPFIKYMTSSELHSTMCSGFSTIAGDTSSILTACVMSVPASLAVSKIRVPETEESLTKGTVSIPESEEVEANFLHAATNGASILLVGGALLSVVSLFYLVDFIFGWLFYLLDIYDTFTGPDLKTGEPTWVSIKLALSFVFFPAAWLIGIPLEDCRKAGEFMSLKMVVNEFVAYMGLADYAINPGHLGNFHPRTVKLLAFALCGFANVSSIGVQIGCLSAMAPTRSSDLAKLAVSAMICGTVSTWLCAAVAGTLM